MADQSKFVFPQWVNYLLPLAILGGLGAGPYVAVLWTYGASADTLNLGYMPEQPVPYSHEIHVGQLGLDCRYCHTTVDKAAFAAIPPTETCINCHAPGTDPITGEATSLSGIWQGSEKLEPIWHSHATGEPVKWVKVHDLPDYTYFNHEAHVTKGVSCVSCHGRVDKMEEVYQAKNLSMGWCLECHRAPEEHLRPVEHVFDLDWSPLEDNEVQQEITAGNIAEGDIQAAQLFVGRRQKDLMRIHDTTYMTSCSTCHR